MNKKMKIACIGIGMSCFLVGGLMFGLNKDTNRNEGIEVTNKVSQEAQNKMVDEVFKEVPNEEPMREESDQNDVQEHTVDYYPADYSDDMDFSHLAKEGAPNMSDIYAKTIIKQMRELNSNFEFEEAGKVGYEALNAYKLTDSETCKQLNRLYYDSGMMQGIKVKKDVYNDTDYRGLLSTLRDKEDFFNAIMYIERPHREELITESQSLNPVFTGGMYIKNVAAVDPESDLYITCSAMNYDVTELWKFEFEIEKNDMIAYIGKGRDGYFIQKIEAAKEGSTNYLTVEQWEEAYKK